MLHRLGSQIKEIVLFMLCLMGVKIMMKINTMTDYTDVLGSLIGGILAALILSIPVIIFSVVWDALVKHDKYLD